MTSRLALVLAAAAMLSSGVARAAAPTSYDELKNAAAKDQPAEQVRTSAKPTKAPTSYDDLIKAGARASAATPVDMTPRIPTTTDQARGICNQVRHLQVAAR